MTGLELAGAGYLWWLAYRNHRRYRKFTNEESYNFKNFSLEWWMKAREYNDDIWEERVIKEWLKPHQNFPLIKFIKGVQHHEKH